MFYKVTGKIKRRVVADGLHIENEALVDRVAFAKTPEAAADRALGDAVAEAGYTDGEWVGEPEAVEIPEDQAMRLVGAPVLPGF